MSIKKGKDLGEDGIALKMVEALGNLEISELTKLFNILYDTRNVIRRQSESIFVALLKVEATQDCSKLSTINIMSQVTKI